MCEACFHWQVPEHEWHVTPVHLLATAGLRLIEEDQVSGCGEGGCQDDTWVIRNTSNWVEKLQGDRLPGKRVWQPVLHVAGFAEPWQGLYGALPPAA